MKSFSSNKIYLDSETLAEQLRSARQAKKLKLAEVAKKLNINYKYLEALEKCEYEELPKGVYGKNFLREYALFLGLDYHRLVKVYLAEKNHFDAGEQKSLFSKQVVSGYYFWAMPKFFKNLIISAVIMVCFVYLAISSNKIMSPPILSVDAPKDNLITTSHSFEVSGDTEPEVELTINNEPVLSDTRGKFSKAINLKAGINIISVTASRKYGKSTTIVRQILVKDKS